MITTTATKEEAERIGRILVEERLAACVQIVNGIESIYRWEGKVCQDAECQMHIKTEQCRVESVTQRILDLHSYDVPEIITLPIRTGSREYLAWISASVR